MDADQSSQGALLPRLILANDTWLEDVRLMISLAHLIVVDCLGLNSGLRSELEAIQQGGKCDNTVILLHRDRSELDQAEDLARVMADVTGGTLAADPRREWMTEGHPLLAPFARVGYVEDLVDADLPASPLFADLFGSVDGIRSAVRLVQRGTNLVEAGDVGVASLYLSTGLRLAEGIPGWAERAVAWFNFGVVVRAAGRDAPAITAFERARDAAASMNDPGEQGRAQAMIGDVQVTTGRFTDATASLLAALSPLERAEDKTYVAQSLRLLAAAARGSGDEQRATAAEMELQRLEESGRWSRSEAAAAFTAAFPERST